MKESFQTREANQHVLPTLGGNVSPYDQEDGQQKYLNVSIHKFYTHMMVQLYYISISWHVHRPEKNWAFHLWGPQSFETPAQVIHKWLWPRHDGKPALQGFPQLRYPKCKKNVFWFPSYFPTCILYIGLRRVVPIRGAKCSDHVIESFLHSSFTWGQRIWSEFFSCQHVCTAACSIFVNQKHLRIHPKEVTRLHGTYPNS